MTEPIENFLNNIGLGTPTMRFIAGAGVMGAILYAVKPSIMFDKKGEPLGFGTGGTAAGQTVMPWYLAAGGTGLILAVFI